MTLAFQRMFGILERWNNNQVTPSLSKPQELSYIFNTLIVTSDNEDLATQNAAQTLYYFLTDKRIRGSEYKDYSGIIPNELEQYCIKRSIGKPTYTFLKISISPIESNQVQWKRRYTSSSKKFNFYKSTKETEWFRIMHK